MDIEKLRIKVKIPTGDILEYEVSPSDTILSLLTKLKEVVGVDEKDQQIGINRNIPKSQLNRSFFSHCTFGEAQLKDGDTLDLYLRAGGCRLFCKSLNGDIHTIDADIGDSIGFIKGLIQDKLGHPVERQRLLFVGRELEDHRTVSDSGMNKDSTFHLVLRL